MATYTHKGTKVKGTSEGVASTPNMKRNDTYLNTQTGHVYVCTEAEKNWARWRYLYTAVIAKPDQAVYSLKAPTRDSGNRVMRAKWNLSSWQKNSQNGKRMTSQYRLWQINTWINGKHYPIKVANDFGVNTTETAINLNNITIGDKQYTRDSFYPVTSRTLTSVTCAVYPQNEKGKGPVAKESRAFKTPRAPSIPMPVFNDETGQLTFTITTDPGDDYYERYDTRYKMTAINTRVSKREVVVYDTDDRRTSFPVSYDARDYMQLTYDQYIKVTVEAWARGFRGDSEHTIREYYISYPAQVSITKADVSTEDSTGKCTIEINTNYTKAHPVDRVKLEYLANVDYPNADVIPGDAVWEDTDIIDDGQCDALSVAITKLIPEKGKYTWLRVKSWHATESRLYRYSDFVNVMHKEPPTAQDDNITILSAVPAQSGQAIVVQLAWNPDGQDDSTGTELSWSDELDTWESTKLPDAFTFDWSKGPITSEGVTYQDSARITIKGLKEGVRYYIKARRYLEADVISYSDYSDYATCVTSQIPESIVATLDKYIPVGSSLPVYWTFSGNGVQTRWQIEAVDSENVRVEIVDEGTEHEHQGRFLPIDESIENVILASGEGSMGFAQISAERLEQHAVNDVVMVRVGASTGSDFVWSDIKPVTIVEAPTLDITADSTLTEQPFGFTATASVPCRLLVIMSSEGATGQFPTGRRTQTNGDTIHSQIYEPEWTEGQSGVSTSIELPPGLEFWNNGSYELSVTAIDPVTGLNSDPVIHEITVDWDAVAADPFGYVTLTPIDEVDDTGKHRKAVQIELTPPQDASETDVYDVYRLNGDGAQLIGAGLPLTYTAVDEYAPFGEDLTLYYRVAIRTVDGDTNYADFEYSADGDYLRFDWGDGFYLESPYTVRFGDSYNKSVDIRQHMDGTSGGYWNSNIERKGSLNTDIIRLIQPTEIASARQLARYPGTVFVRTPGGDAYEADVQVTDLSLKNKAVYTVAFDATEVGLTQEFMLPIPAEEE